ncbi:Nucleolar protein 9 [Rhynchospora pubera]|uniref:Nucleolar protein 9 n=1 Tax=Rhynchospora pubera TaxID=906938 RepID=A0AAV8HYQ9_9POAL|nr:Nucleolar protein 9 [Rhynchospora pubera]
MVEEKEKKKKGKEKRHEKGQFGKHKERNLSYKEKGRDKDGNKGKLSRDSVKEAKFGHSKPTLTYADSSKPPPSAPRKRVDPETAKYFSEITNLLESNTVELDDISAICGNALEEARGKELELTTDPIISRTIQKLLESCDLDQLCGFLRGCAESFPIIATDGVGSHVAETAIKALAKHMYDESSISYIEDTLSLICKIVAKDSVSVMQSRYGSHVLRSLLCLCKGVPLDRLDEFHVTKRSDVLATRVSSGPNKPDEGKIRNEFENRFESVFKFLVRELVDRAKYDMAKLRVDQFSSFVLQMVLRLSVGNNEELLYLIKILLCGPDQTLGEENIIGSEQKDDIMALLEDTASSHLLEVIIEVAPENLYHELLTEIFMGSLFVISSHYCGNYVAQALISSARNSNQVTQILDELGEKVKDLIKFGKSGVVASLLAACQRLETNRRECCQALAEAVTGDTESNNNMIEHILYLDSFILEMSTWKWPSGEKMSVLGCLMLQTIFKYPKQYIRLFIENLVSMEDEHVFQTAKDSGGARVIEAFLSSHIGAKIKLKLIAKLKGHFGDLAMNASSSFTVEKCFTESNISLKEAICGELLDIRLDISKARHGFHLLRKLDIDGYARQPEQWRVRQKSKETAYREFQAVFGEPRGEEIKINASYNENHNGKQKHDYNADGESKKFNHVEMPSDKKQKTNEKDGNHSYDSSKMSKKQKVGKPLLQKSANKFISNSTNTPFVRQSGKKDSAVSELAQLASKSDLTAGEVRSLFNASLKNEKGQSKNFKVPFVRKRKR